jgi:hypothetical protein
VKQFSGLEAVSRQKVSHDAIGKDPRSGPFESALGQKDLALGSRFLFRFSHLYRFLQGSTDSIKEDGMSWSGLSEKLMVRSARIESRDLQLAMMVHCTI